MAGHSRLARIPSGTQIEELREKGRHIAVLAGDDIDKIPAYIKDDATIKLIEGVVYVYE